MSASRRRLGSLAVLPLALLVQASAAENRLPQLLLLNPISELTAPEDASIVLRVAVSDAETPVAGLQLTAVPSNTRLLPTTGIVVEGSGNERVVRLTPVRDANGSSELQLVVSDAAGGIARRGTPVTWTSVDDPPVFDPIPNQVTSEGAPPLLVPIAFSDVDSAGGPSLSVSNSRPNFIQTSSFVGAGTNRWLSLRPAPGVVGSATITLTANWFEGNTPRPIRVPFVLTVLPREFAGSNTFGGSGSMAVTFDANQDGWPDLVTGFETGLVTLNQNRTGRLFSSLQFPFPASLVALGDTDGDGDVDVFLGSLESAGALLRNDTVSTLANPQLAKLDPLARTNRTANVAWADFDGDGDLDLIAGGGPDVANKFSPRPVLFARNDGAGVFVTLTDRLPPTRDALIVADFNSDGRPDVLLGNPAGQTNQAVVWHNEGGFRFAPSPLRVPAAYLLAAGTADFNGDGRLDLWVLHRSVTNNPTSSRTLALWQQTSVGFAEALRLPGVAVSQAGAPAWGDFDGDGWPDFIAPMVSPALWGTTPTSRVTNCFTLYRNDGRGGFTPGNFLFNNSAGAGPAAVDFDRDGSLDLWVPENQGRLMFNQLRRANLPPETPSGLFALADGTNVLFTWLPARDPNQSAPLTYNLRVGTRPGANDVIASMSLADGTRLVTAPGNAGHVTARRLLLGPVDTEVLYWSVQAVDNSFAGGLWAPEQTVRVQGIPNLPPQIQGLADVVMNEDTTAVLKVTVTDDFSLPAEIKTEVFTSNRTLFPGFKLGPARATTFTPTTNRPITLVPAENAFGEAEITMIATDARGASATNRAKVTVRPVNDPPEITVISPQHALRGVPASPVAFNVRDVESPAGALSVSASSSNPALVSAEGITLGGAGATRSLIVVPATAAVGTVGIRLVVTDAEGRSAEAVVDYSFLDQGWSLQEVLPGLGSPNTVAWADLDNDGTLELLTVGTDASLTLFQPTAPGLVTVASLGNAFPSNLQIADLDNDGDLDLVMAENVPNPEPFQPAWRNRIYRNDGGCGFRALTEPALPQGVVRLADSDGDGRPDIFLNSLSETGSGRIDLYRNLGGRALPVSPSLAFSRHDRV